MGGLVTDIQRTGRICKRAGPGGRSQGKQTHTASTSTPPKGLPPRQDQLHDVTEMCDSDLHIQLSPRLVSAYTGVHATTLAFVTLALINFLLQFDLRYMNPVIASWRIDEQAICRDIDAEFGWDEEWIMQCLKSLGMVQIGAACGGLVLVIAQWWALITVRSWSIDLQDQRMNRGDLEKADFEVEEYDRFEKQAY